MYYPKDISDMPESEVPWEFLVDAPERRSRDRSVDHNCEDPCERVIHVENRLTLLANEFYTYKRACKEEVKEASEERKLILSKLDQINTHLSTQKGFFAGAVWLGSAVITFVIAVVGVAVSYFKG